MVGVHFHPGDWQSGLPGGGGARGHGVSPPRGCDGSGARPGGRLNLLLSHAGWDEDPWVDQLPRLLQPMGVASFRAGTGREASSVMERTRIHIAVVDLALPLDERGDPASEGGTRLLELIARLREPPPVLVIKRSRSGRDDGREMSAALRAGAFAVLDRPRGASDLNSLLEVMRRLLARFHEGRWPNA